MKTGIGIVFFLVALTFVYRSFYAMRIPVDKTSAEENGSKPLVPPIGRTGGEIIANHTTHGRVFGRAFLF